VSATFGLLVTAGLLTAQAKDPPDPADAKPAETKKPAPAAGTPMFASEQVRVINEKIAEKWKEEKLIPSAKASDYTFIRRASLDIIGRIAKPEEIEQFLRDPAPTRRMLLVDRLLKSADYARNWATIWTTWLMTRTSPATYREQMHLWLEEQFSRQNCTWDKVVADLITATGKNTENGAVNFILSNLGEASAPDKVTEEGAFNMVPITSRASRLFMGVKIQCTQCHDHPFKAQWKQKDFWSTNAFFRQVERKGNPAMVRNMPVAPELVLVDNSQFNQDLENPDQPGIVFYERRNGALMMTRPEFTLSKDGKKKRILAGTERSRRQELAEAIVQSDLFAKAFINRMWFHFFGHGMNTPGDFDDFGEDNQITHPELMDYLAKEFRAYQHNPRELIRWICNSEAYGLVSVANQTNAKPEAEPFFSRMLLKSMSPEQLFESLMEATQAEQAETKDAKKKLREQWLKNLIVNFGDDEGNEVSFNGTVVQALILMNGKEINEAIAHKNKGPVARAALKHHGNQQAIMNDIFLAVLNRPATAAESQQIPRKLRMRIADRDPWAPWQDLEWALLNSNEFILNH
jgi:hypothetical protein